MIVLDTNVLSEVMRPVPDAGVLAWLAVQPRLSLFTSTITRGELLYGVFLLPEGRRKEGLLHVLQDIFEEDLAGQILSFDSASADAFAEIAIARREAGRPISQNDAMIAAVARSRGASLATRNIRDFVGCGVHLIDPWSGQS